MVHNNNQDVNGKKYEIKLKNNTFDRFNPKKPADIWIAVSPSFTLQAEDVLGNNGSHTTLRQQYVISSHLAVHPRKTGDSGFWTRLTPSRGWDKTCRQVCTLSWKFWSPDRHHSAATEPWIIYGLFFFLHPIGFVSSEASRQSVLLRSCSGEVRSYKAAVDRCGRKREATESSGEICTNRGADQTPLGRSLSRCTISCPISTPQLQTKKGGDPTVNFVPRANDIYIVYI